MKNMMRDRRKIISIKPLKKGETEDGNRSTAHTPEELIGMMWQLTLDAWAFKEDIRTEPRLQRHLVVLKRREKNIT
ncbi:MAG: hypothetical protein AB7H86_10865 [Blastocatellales bacterium]